jgi:putative restriction endonuclease
MSTTGIKTPNRENRASEEYARYVFENLYNDKSVRTVCARLLADSILTAHRISASCWSLTLFRDKIRLNVGPVEVLVLSLDDIFLVISDLDDSRFNNNEYNNFIKPSEVHYTSVPINQRLCNVPPEAIGKFYPQIAVNHRDFIQKAARRRERTLWQSSFSLGLIIYLNNLLKETLPVPAYFSKQVDAEQPNILQEIEQFQDSYETLQETTREAVIQSRIGQGQFRILLVEYWRGCSVTGCQQTELLRASHIKPWRHSSNAERLDIYNGLLLLPNLDACFDSGLISFDDEGRIVISSQLDESTLVQLGINSNLKLLRVEQRHKDFLRFHRENIFRR